MHTASPPSCFESARVGNPHDASSRPKVSPQLFVRT